MDKKTIEIFTKRSHKIEKEIYGKSLKMNKKILRLLKECKKRTREVLSNIVTKYSDDVLEYSDLTGYIDLEDMKDLRSELETTNQLMKRKKIKVSEMMEYQIGKEITKTYANINNQLTLEFEKTYKKTRKAVGGGMLKDKTLTFVDTKKMEKVLSYKNFGKNFSERIWEHRTKLSNEVKKEIAQGFASQYTHKEIAERIAKRFEVSYSNAERLVITENSFFQNQATLDTFKEGDVKKYMYVAEIDNRTSQICRALDGIIFKVKDSEVGINTPPMHVFCRSTLIAYFED